MSSVSEMHWNRNQLVETGRTIYREAERAGREPTAEEKRRFDDVMAGVDKLDDEIRQERLKDAQRSLEQRQGRKTDSNPLYRTPDVSLRSGGYVETKSTPDELRGFETYLRGGGQSEYRALQGDSNLSGGYLLAPQQMAAGVLHGLDNRVFIRQLATKFQLTNTQSLGVPTLDTDPSDADWTSELATGNEDTAMAFGKRELLPRAVAKRIKASGTLLRQVPSAVNLIQDRLTFKFSVTAEKAYLTGDWANKPLGLFTASSDGISTSRDVSSGNTSTAITMDGLISALYALKNQYVASKTTAWLFHRDALKMLRKLRDDSGATVGTGQYLWQPSTQLGQPDTLLGLPVYSSEYCPNTFTTGQYVGLLGDFSYYWIADSLAMTIQRLDELYAESNQIGFIGRLETDGMPILEEAFVRVKLA